MSSTPTVAPGAHILARDEAWRVIRVDPTHTGGKAIRCVGLSELVRDKEAIFLDEYEPALQVLDPAQTELVRDTSSNYQASLLVLESQLRRIPPTDSRLHLGHRAAMDVLPYQLEPAAKALRQPRQRILIADAVGLGKTLEAGILLSELIARGHGKRILVVTLKSLLTQFQKEMWCRFCIPLVRLDSVGLQRIRHQIPTNHNPFYHFDRSIISIDTLKQNNEYRHYLETASWDVIVIDEAHNVARRGANASLRARLAELLSSRSDTLILLSATPHDGRPRSFASLMNMLDPTAIADEEDYAPEDISGLYIRRFRKDIVAQLGEQFPERAIAKARAQASSAEEAAYERFAALRLSDLSHQGGQRLFKTVLEKALLSSPRACLQTIHTRLRRLEKDGDTERSAADVSSLRALAQALEAIGPGEFGKYQKLLEVLRKDLRWTGSRSDDRLVIFTERIETLNFLRERLPLDLGLRDNQVDILHGTMGDVDQQRIVENFGKEKSPLRLLIASDVAAEGINLHYLCHQMIHFDIPWSLLVFQQRNGRIDRYGQKRQPLIVYMLTDTSNERIHGDARILEILIDKEDKARKNIGDPSALMGVYDIEQEEAITARAIETGNIQGFEAELEDIDLFELDLDAAQEEEAPAVVCNDILSFYDDDFHYLRSALDFLANLSPLHFEANANEHRIDLELTDSLRRRLRQLPRELDFSDNHLLLSADRDEIQRAMEAARREEITWPAISYLWPLHPIFDWVADRLGSHFGRHGAPVVCLDQGLARDEQVFLLSGLLPNRKSQPLVHRWFAAVFRGQRLESVEDARDFVRRTGLGRRKIPNRVNPVDPAPIPALLLSRRAEAVRAVHAAMAEFRKQFEAELHPKLEAELKKLEQLRDRKLAVQLQLFADKTGPRAQEQRAQQERSIRDLFAEYRQWIRDSLTTEEHPFLQVLAVFVPEGGAS